MVKHIVYIFHVQTVITQFFIICVDFIENIFNTIQTFNIIGERVKLPKQLFILVSLFFSVFLIYFCYFTDPQCHLMIPQQVMNKIKAATNSRLRTQAHRAAYFISEKVDENVATIGM